MAQLPEDFLRRTTALLGANETASLAAALTGEPAVSIRINTRKQTGQEPKGDGDVPWCTTGRYLATRPAFTFDPLFHAGCYYVQEASSMFVEQAFHTIDEMPLRVLDLCAAPGGKSTLWRSLLPDRTLLVCNEPIRRRAHILAENMAKWGHPDVAVTNAYPEEFASLTGFFDVIAADVPCSGEGMFRKDSGAIDEWSPAAVTLCAERQLQIVRDVWPALREGGWFVYSTCTFNAEEDEENVRRICRELGAEPVMLPCNNFEGVSGDLTGGDLPVARFLPHRVRGEGFFLALLRKTATTPAGRDKKKRREKHEGNVQGGAAVSQWLAHPDEFKFFAPEPNSIAAVRRELADDMQRLRSTVQTLMVGLPLAELKGRKIVPRHELALSTELSATAFPCVELSRDDALAYLRHESFPLGPDVPRGYVVTTYKNARLGFLNNLGTRANNLYPPEWRIRSRADWAGESPEDINTSEL